MVVKKRMEEAFIFLNPSNKTDLTQFIVNNQFQPIENLEEDAPLKEIDSTNALVVENDELGSLHHIHEAALFRGKTGAFLLRYRHILQRFRSGKQPVSWMREEVNLRKTG